MGGKSYDSKYISGSGGGGATTVYLINESDSNRILVSAGGGGTGFGPSGHAGGLSGGNGFPGCNGEVFSIGANQTFGFLPGKGEDGRDTTIFADCGAEGGGGAGGGYFGGTTSKEIGNSTSTSGSGGSSYISGFLGCITNPLGVFEKPIMRSGAEAMPLPDGTESKKGNPRDGFLRITYIPPEISCRQIRYPANIPSLTIYVFILIYDSEN